MFKLIKNKVCRQLIACLLGVLLSVGLYSSTAFAESSYSGYIGNSALAWELTDGILTISGSGEAPVFESPDDQPWAEVRDEIEQVVFTDPGSASFPNLQYYFTNCGNLTRTEIPYTAHIIGTDAYAGCLKLEEILFYYYDSDEFEIIEGAFAADAHVDTKVYLIAEELLAFQRLENYSWLADNRHSTFYDVYSKELYGCGISDCACSQSVCSSYYSYASMNNGKHYILLHCDPCHAQKSTGSESCSGDPCYKCGYSSKCSICGYATCRCCTSCGRYPCVCCKHTSTYDQTSGCTVSTYCKLCGECVSSAKSHKSLSTTYTYYNTSYHTQKTVCSSCSTTTVNQRYAHSTSVKCYDASYHGTYCTVCSSWITTSVAHFDANADGKCDACAYLLQVTITWNNEGTLDSTAQTIGSALTLSTPPAKAGYMFTGWYTAASGGTQVTSSSTVPSSDTTYYAQWTANTYAITWDDGQGNRSFSTQTYDTALILPTTDPTKTGYTFIGWFIAPTGGSQVTASTIYQTADASTYYAQYTANSYVITWDVEGSASTSVQFYDAALALPVTPTKSGYTFTGWVDGAGNAAPTTYQVDGPSTYYATFSPNTYTITWQVDGVPFDTTLQVYDTAIAFPTAEPSKDKHHFDGWWTEEIGGYPVTSTDLYQTAGDMTYDAHWIQVFSVTVPATMPVAVGEDGAVYAPELQIHNASTGSVKVSSVTLNSLNGWTIVPYDTNMAGEKVDAKLVGLSLNGLQTSTRGASETIGTNWVIAEDATLTLSYDAVVSATSQAYTEETILEVVFIIEWA